MLKLISVNIIIILNLNFPNRVLTSKNHVVFHSLVFATNFHYLIIYSHERNMFFVVRGHDIIKGGLAGLHCGLKGYELTSTFHTRG